ncbi:MAG: DUF1499 domain-containing protein [Gemmatimonadota bacterium]
MSGRADSGASGGSGAEVVDTRKRGQPEGCVYAVPFAEVWDLVASEIQSQRGWDLVHADEERGMFTVVCRSRFPKRTDDLTIWIRLDENGLTRLDVRSSSREGRRQPGGLKRRVESLLGSVERSLGPGARVRG